MIANHLHDHADCVCLSGSSHSNLQVRPWCHTAGVRNLFTITGCIDGGLSLAGCKNNRFNSKFNLYLTMRVSDYLDILSKYLLIMELCFDAILCSKSGEENSNTGHIKCTCGPQVPHPCQTVSETAVRSTNRAPAFSAEKLSSMSCISEVTWPTVNLPCWKPDCSLPLGGLFNTSVDESLEDLEGDTQKRYRAIALWVPSGFSNFGIETSSALFQIFVILSWHKQEVRKSQNQDLRADLVWSINSGKMESRLEDFPSFRRLRAAASFSGLEGPEI